MANLSFQFHRLRPEFWIDGQRTHLSCLRVEESTVMSELAIAKKLRQHGERARCERLIDEWLLPVQCLDGRTARQWIFPGIYIDDLRV